MIATAVALPIIVTVNAAATVTNPGVELKNALTVPPAGASYSNVPRFFSRSWYVDACMVSPFLLLQQETPIPTTRYKNVIDHDKDGGVEGGAGQGQGSSSAKSELFGLAHQPSGQKLHARHRLMSQSLPSTLAPVLLTAQTSWLDGGNKTLV
jgi:hypothetical protein